MANPPEDFKCPISLEIMSDPVIVSTGQTYERSSIQRWLDSGERTCPKTKLPLHDTKLIPNYALRSLICQWAQSHGVDLKKPVDCKHPGYGPAEREGAAKLKETVECLCKTLSSNSYSSLQLQARRDAVKEIRVLAKENRETRLCIVECGATAKILPLLCCGDVVTEENAMVALCNLSMDDENKVGLVAEGAVDAIVNALKNGSMETRAMAAVTLTSLAVVDVNKATIGTRSDAIPALVKLLNEGNTRGKKEATTALYSLCFYPDNKRRAVIAGAVPLLFGLVSAQGPTESSERPLEVLDMLSLCSEGRDAIGQQRSVVRTLMRFVKDGSFRSKEHAVATLSSLCCGNKHWALEARDAGAKDHCLGLLQDGTSRSRRKASALIKALEELDV